MDESDGKEGRKTLFIICLKALTSEKKIAFAALLQ